MPLSTFRGTQNVSWICFQCGIPNFSTTLFETTMADSVATDNSYSILSDEPASQASSHSPTHSSHSFTSLDSSIGSPMHASSPVRVNHQPGILQPKQNTFRVLTINFQSIRAKRSSFWLLLSEADPDIIIGCETWLHKGIFEREVIPCGYHIIARRDRETDHHGGVVIAVKDNLIGSNLSISTTTEFVAASIECPGNQQLIIAALYRPPNSDQQYMQELCEKIRHLHTQFPKATIWVSGDANLPDIDWETNSIHGSNYNHAISQLLLDIVYDTGSEQIVKFPTRGENILDVFISNRPSLVTKAKAMPGVSDHDIVFVETQAQAARKKPTRRKILLWKNVDFDDMKKDIATFSRQFTSDNNAETDIDQLWGTFRNFCSSIMENKVPSKLTSTRYSQPWTNTKIKRLSRRKKRAFHRAKASGTNTDKDRYKELQKETHMECRKAYNSYVKDIVTTDKNPKKLYSFINSRRCDSSGVSLLKKGGIAHSDPKVKASILNEQFSSVFTEEDLTSTPSMSGNPFPSVPTFLVDNKGVHKLLLDLNPHKAQGPDNIPTRFLKEFATEISPALTLVFQASLQQGMVPDDWKQAFVTPVFKKGDRTAPSNYRPISLTSVCSKLLEHIIHSQVMRHLDHHGILSDQQHGFRKRRSCESQLVLTIQDLARGLEEGEQIDAVLLDFSKAFDKVPHKRLSTKLLHYGITGQLLKWIESFLSNRSQQVLIDGQMSTPSPVTSGVPQGTVLGPLLFLLYINDMPEKVSSTTRLFADDSLLYRKVKTERDSAILQEDLRKLETWEQDWQMAFNPSKCEVIHITGKRNPLKTKYQLHGHNLNVTKSGKYLGVTLTEKLNWNEHVDITAKKANNSLAFLRRNLASCPKDIKAQSYKSLVRPILEYASTSWDPHTSTNINRLEAVQRRAARFVEGDYKTTSSTSQMIANLGWQPLQQRRTDARLVLMYRITYMLIDIPASMFLHPSTLSTRGHTVRYMLPFCRTDIYRHSFFPAGIRLWNQLPESLATATTLEGFKAGLATLY